MFLPRLNAVARQIAAIALTGMLSVGSWAQETQPAPAQAVPSAPQAPQPHQFELKDYAKPHSHFPNPIAPYTARHVATPDLTNTPRIDSLLQNGKIYLSMNDAVALALENNLDIAIARYNLNIADTDILRAKAGAATLGINAGIVQNTPGGAQSTIGSQVGSGTGGTNAGAGGAGAGLGGLVGSTLGDGPTITSFDPIITGTFQEDHSTTLSTNVFTGAPVLGQNTGTENFTYTQGFQWGTNMTVGFNNTRNTSNSTLSNLSPQLNSGFQFRLTQHLLQGFGFAPNTRFIRIAKNDREISDVAFRLQIITTVDQIENMYWDLVYAYENVRVAKESVAFAQKTLSDNQKQVQIGTLAPIEVVRAQSTVSSDQQVLTVAETNLELEQLLMKNAISRTLVDPRLADAEVIPTSTMQLPAQEAVVPTQDLINDALSHRTELSEARINLTNQEISNKAVRSSLLPSLDMFAYYGGSGVGGAQNPANLCVNQSTASQMEGFCSGPNPSIPATTNPVAPTTSYAGTLNQLINSTAPDKGVGLTLSIPLRNRVAQATQIRSELEYRQAQMRLQQIENQVRIEVRNAQFSVQQNRASVESAEAAVAYARQSLDSEQKKLALGASTSTLVLQNQSALATSESTRVSAMAAYEKARVELDRATGLLLDTTGIQIADAERGQVINQPHVPDITQRKEEPPVTPQPAPEPQAAPQQ